MNINIIVLMMMASVVGFYTWRAFLHKDDPPPSALPWVPIDANKHRSFVNQTRDAGMFTERARRVAIIGSNNCGVNMKPPFQKHFSNGVMETFLTGICAVVKPTPVPPIPPIPPSPSFGWDVIVDGTFADNSLQDVIVEGNGGPNYVIIDGNPRPNFVEPEIVVENSYASPSFFDVLFDGVGFDWSTVLDGNVF
jgi:hypothetical protein